MALNSRGSRSLTVCLASIVPRAPRRTRRFYLGTGRSHLFLRHSRRLPFICRYPGLAAYLEAHSRGDCRSASWRRPALSLGKRGFCRSPCCRGSCSLHSRKHVCEGRGWLSQSGLAFAVVWLHLRPPLQALRGGSPEIYEPDKISSGDSAGTRGSLPFGLGRRWRGRILVEDTPPLARFTADENPCGALDCFLRILLGPHRLGLSASV